MYKKQYSIVEMKIDPVRLSVTNTNVDKVLDYFKENNLEDKILFKVEVNNKIEIISSIKRAKLKLIRDEINKLSAV